jgi:ATP-binding cassette, subfamily B, bacterial
VRDWLRLLREVTLLTVRGDRRASIILVVLALGQAAVIAGIGISQRHLVDGSAAGETGTVIFAVVLGSVAYAISATADRVRGNLSLYLVGRVRGRLVESIQRMVSSIPTVTHVEHAPYIDRWNRIFGSSQAIAAMPWSTLASIVAATSLAVTVGLLASVSPLLMLLALLGVPLFLASRRADRLLRDSRDAGTELLRREQRLHDLCVTPEPAKEVMLSGGGPALSEEAERLWEEAARRETVARLHGFAWQMAAWTTYAAGFTGALVVVAGLIREGRTTVGAAVLVFSLATQLRQQLWAVLDSLSMAAEAGHAVSHYWWLRRYLASATRGGGPAPAALTGGITLHDVSFRYPSARDVLDRVSLHLPAASTVAIVGANGAGKSTLIKLLTGVHEPTGGRITVDDQPLQSIASAAWRSRLSGVYQDFAQLRLRVRETVGVGSVRHVRDRETVGAAISRAGAPFGEALETRLGAVFDGVEPSLGQWQRLALARSLMREVDGAPLCVVLDEPTAALDPLAEHELFQHFVDQVRAATSAGAVTVLVSHRFTTVRMADLIVVLSDGRVAERGTHEELMAAGGTYAELYRLQERAYR